MRFVILAVVVAGCGGPAKVVETEENEPAWAGEYARASARGCECVDDPCIRAARESLSAILAAHGGIEEAPPSIHANLAKFEACWLTTSRDLARDLTASADGVCACTTTSCIGEYYERMWKLADKYGVAHPDQLRDTNDAAAAAAWDRAVDCAAKVTISSEDYLAILTTTNTELCACTMPECGKAVIDRSDATLGKYLVVKEDSSLAASVAAAEAQRCKCAKKFPPTTEIDTEIPIGGVPIKVTGYVSMHWSCDDKVE